MNTLLSLTAIILVSFGTSFKDSREATIDAVTKDVQAVYAEAKVYPAFTSEIIRKKIEKNEGVHIMDVAEALESAKAAGCKYVVLQPTHMMYGLEYNEMIELAKPYEKNFDKVVFGQPLLAEKDDISAVLKAVVPQIKVGKKEAVVFMGHGTEYFSNFLYAALDYQAKLEGYNNVFVGTVEAFPAAEDVIALTKKAGFKAVTLTPLMLVAGDHANNDMAGDEDDSWKNQFKAAGFKTVNTLVKGLGEYEGVRAIYVSHIKDALEKLESEGND
jgi:sirohydrochlorin cobaltochelatase